jgi:DNA-binding transcriptional LysR family regulator
VAACRRDHPLAKKRRIAWADLAACDFIAIAQSSGNRLLLDQALAGVPERPVPVCEAQHVTTLLGLVEAGLGVAAVPAMAMPGKDHPLLVSVPLDGPVVTRHVGLIRRSGRTLAPAAQQLYGFFSEMAAPARGRRRPAPRQQKP